MAPKKRDKEKSGKRSEQTRADHELFLQAFEKPTQIYKYLKSRSKFSPLFLNRNLTYMPKRRKSCSRSSLNFIINSIKDRQEALQKEASLQIPSSGFLTITYLGFFKNETEYCKDPVKVETLLLKICHQKRKETCPIMTTSFGTVYMESNPSSDSEIKTTVSIPTDQFNLTNGHIVKSYHLLIKVGINDNGFFNKGSPIIKKRKLSIKDNNGVPTNCNENGSISNNKNGVRHHYATNLIIYDNQNRCLLTSGEYKLVLHELSSNGINNNYKLTNLSSTWETLPMIENEKDTPGFEKYSEGPNVHFNLQWTRESSKEHSSKKIIRNGGEFFNGSSPGSRIDMNRTRNRNQDANQLGYKLKIVYQFLYNENSRQQTEASVDLHCPWCSVDCYTLYALLKHLKLCHSRFTFSYIPTPFGARIDVAINEQYDGSYLGGSSTDTANGTVGYCFSKYGPVRRTTISNLLVCHPKRPRHPSLSEFLNEVEENENFDSQRSYITGHNRLYYHTSTCLPVHAKEMEVDSEDESDPKWLQKKTQMMIDDFTDVNYGEKELMKMWNLHVMKHGFVGDCQIPLAANLFLKERGKELLTKNLYRNFVLHMCNLFDFGLVSPITVYTTIQRLQELIGKGTDCSKILHEAWTAQRKHWLADDNARKFKVISDIKNSNNKTQNNSR